MGVPLHQGSRGVIVCHDHSLAEYFKSRLNLLRPRVVVRIQHAPHHGLAHLETASQFGLAHIELPNRPIEGEFGHDPQGNGHQLLPAFQTRRLGYICLVSHCEGDTAAQTVDSFFHGFAGISAVRVGGGEIGKADERSPVFIMPENCGVCESEHLLSFYRSRGPIPWSRHISRRSPLPSSFLGSFRIVDAASSQTRPWLPLPRPGSYWKRTPRRRANRCNLRGNSLPLTASVSHKSVRIEHKHFSLDNNHKLQYDYCRLR